MWIIFTFVFFFETNTHEYNLILTNNYFEVRNKYYYSNSWMKLFTLFTFVSLENPSICFLYL